MSWFQFVLAEFGRMLVSTVVNGPDNSSLRKKVPEVNWIFVFPRKAGDRWFLEQDDHTIYPLYSFDI